MSLHYAGPFASLFQETKSSLKEGKEVGLGVLGLIFLFVYLFVALKLEDLS